VATQEKYASLRRKRWKKCSKANRQQTRHLIEKNAQNGSYAINYKTYSRDLQKALELDAHSKLSFIYETNFDYFDAGRPKAVSITIDVIENAPRLF